MNICLKTMDTKKFMNIFKKDFKFKNLLQKRKKKSKNRDISAPTLNGHQPIEGTGACYLVSRIGGLLNPLEEQIHYNRTRSKQRRQYGN